MPTALLTFHHLLSPKKITSLRALSRKLTIHGVYKRGYPGLLFVSGERLPDIDGFVRTVKQMRWQTCTVAGMEQDLTISFPHKGLEEAAKVRDVVAAAGGGAAEGWVKQKLGFVKED